MTFTLATPLFVTSTQEPYVLLGLLKAMLYVCPSDECVTKHSSVQTGTVAPVDRLRTTPSPNISS